MRLPALLLAAAVVAGAVAATLAARSPRVREELRGWLVALGALPPRQETARYRARLAAQRAENPRLAPGCTLLLGDSLAEGFPPALAEPRGWVVRGISGDRVRDVRARLEPSALGAPCRRVALLAGTNDVVGDRRAPEAVAEEMAEILDLLRADGRQVLLHTLPPVGEAAGPGAAEAVRALDRRLAELARTRPDVTLVDLSTALQAGEAGEPPWQADGVHLRPWAYRAWARLLDQVLAGPHGDPPRG